MKKNEISILDYKVLNEFSLYYKFNILYNNEAIQVPLRFNSRVKDVIRGKIHFELYPEVDYSNCQGVVRKLAIIIDAPELEKDKLENIINHINEQFFKQVKEIKQS